MSLPNKTDSSYENKEIGVLDFIMKMLVWKAQWDVKDQYDKEFNDLSSAKSKILSLDVILVLFGIAMLLSLFQKSYLKYLFIVIVLAIAREVIIQVYS